MFFNFNNRLFTQKRPTIAVLLFLAMFSLFCSSTVFAVDQGQDHIEHLLGNGTELCFLPKMDAEEFKDSDGYCFGFSSVWLYSKWLQFEHPEKVGAYNGDWFKSSITDILGTWSDCDNVKKFALLVEKFQYSQDGTFEKEMNRLDTDGKKIQREYSIASLLTLEQLEQLLKENIIYDHKLIYVYSYDHATALFKDGDSYYYFDPGSSAGERKVSSTDDVARLVFEANDFDPAKPSPLSVQVFSFDEKIQNYPEQQEVLARINPSLVCEGDCVDEISGLHMAVQCGCLESVYYFLNKDVNVNLPAADGCTALMLATKRGHLEVVRLLLEKGANPNLADRDGYTALMIATESGHLEVVRLLLEKGADYSRTNNYGETALMIAKMEGYPKIVKEIKRAIKAKEPQKTAEK